MGHSLFGLYFAETKSKLNMKAKLRSQTKAEINHFDDRKLGNCSLVTRSDPLALESRHRCVCLFTSGLTNN